MSACRWIELTSCDGAAVWVNPARVAYIREGQYWISGQTTTRLFLDETRPNEPFAIDVRETPRQILDAVAESASVQQKEIK